MRFAYCFLPVAVCLPLCACGSKEGGHAPPPLDTELLLGKWQAFETDQLIQSFEFKPDQTFSMQIRNVPEVIPGKYSWSGDYSLRLEYQPSEEVQKACRAALKEMKHNMTGAASKMGGTIGDNILQSAAKYPDELPAKEELRVGLSDRYGPNLSLTTAKGLIWTFKKPK